MGVRFRLLGEVGVVRPADGSHHSIRPRMARALLAVLLLEGPGRVVSEPRLTDSLWDTPPRSADSNLRTHKARLQRELDQLHLTGRIIGSTRDRRGYGVYADRSEVDLVVFRETTAAARQHLRRGEFEAAGARFGAALALWRGPAGADLPSTRRLAALTDGLNNERAEATESLVHAAIGAHRYQDAIADIERCLTENPTRERAWVLLACAHYLNGNPAVAQATIRRACRTLDDAVGLDPGAILRTAEVAAIHHDDDWFRGRVRWG